MSEVVGALCSWGVVVIAGLSAVVSAFVRRPKKEFPTSTAYDEV